MTPKDRHLDTPAEANRDKHINFVALENNDEDPAVDTSSNGVLAKEDADRGKKHLTFDFLVNGVYYLVRIVPFSFNDETRYFVRVNNGPNHVYVWDEQMLQIRSLSDNASILPDELQTAISHKLMPGR